MRGPRTHTETEFIHAGVTPAAGVWKRTGGCSRSVAGAHRRRGGAASSRKGLRPEGRGRSRRPCREPRGSHGRRGTGSTDKNAARCGGDSVAWQAACTAGVPGFALPPGFRPGSASRRQWEGSGRSRSFSGRWGGGSQAHRCFRARDLCCAEVKRVELSQDQT